MSGNPEVPSGSTTLSDVDPQLGRRRRETLGQAFDPRANALNSFRLALATGVILWHSFPLTGRHLPFAVHQLFSQAWVDGFFAVSGFLITSSWLSRPRLGAYFAARGLRIVPGLWVCLAITAFAIAPIGVAIQGGSAARLLLSTAPIGYVVKNSAIWIFQVDIGGTPRGIPDPGMWNGSLWTLQYEVLCYIAVAGLGVVGLLGRRWFLPTAMALALTWAALASYTLDGVPTVAQNGARFAVMFLAGALLHQFRDLIPARWSLVAVSVAVVLVATLLPDYRLVAAIPLAYAVIVSGALIHNERFRLRNDLSYGVYIYACPIQQLLVICGLGILNPIVFTIIAAVATLPFAAMSWFLVEKPAMGLKARIRGKGVRPGLTTSVP
ncbi:MAG: acyltransferase [Mycobacterium sp.]|uniref:acyltransferase family protein n=1 Tax=Mycobacterium sp. TaxID=1785 RepID=UPI003BAE4E4F